MNAKLLNRVTFTTNRASEYASEKEITKQIGGTRSEWPALIFKELIDNALDAAESMRMNPEITVMTTDAVVAVADNGPGIPHSTIVSSLDYETRTSDKNRYISPTRGQLGNALKCLYPLPYLCGGGHIEIHSHGQAYTVQFRLDQIQDAPVVEHVVRPSDVKNGTLIKIYNAELACSLNPETSRNLHNADEILDKFAAFNSHLTASINGQYIHAESGGMKQKWRTTDPTSAHWYTPDDFKQLVAGYIQAAPEMTVRTLVKSFDGLSGTAKQKVVTEQAGLTSATLASLHDGHAVNDKAEHLLAAMASHAKPVKAARLGVIGQSRFETISSLYGMDHCKYKKIVIDDEHNPCVVELAFCYSTTSQKNGRNVYMGVNFTPLLNTNLPDFLSRPLSKSLVSSDDPVFVYFHVTAPRVRFADAAKSNFKLGWTLEKAISEALEVLAKPWLKYARRRDREGRIEAGAIRKANDKPKNVSTKQAAYSVMAEAYAKASGNGKYPANARQIMYAARPKILAITGETELNDQYFTQHLLPDFMAENTELTDSWDVAYDERGHFAEPHTGHSFGLGTLAVRRYTSNLACDTNQVVKQLRTLSTYGPDKRYSAALFIEKEGFMQLLNTAKIAERYDIAIMSTKGVSNTSSRALVEWLSNKGVTIYVMHDFDKAGFTIAHTLQTDTRRYQFTDKPKIIDLGFRLEDCDGLESEPVSYQNGKDPKINLIESGATQAEADFMVSGGGTDANGKAKAWTGRRVELNAMTSEQLVIWIERKLNEHGVTKLVPDDSAIIESAYIDCLKRRLLTERVEGLKQEIDAIDLSAHVSKNLSCDLAKLLEKQPHLSWDAALYELSEVARLS